MALVTEIVHVITKKWYYNDNHIVILSLYKSPIEKLCNYFLNCTLTEEAARAGPIRLHVQIIATKH